MLTFGGQAVNDLSLDYTVDVNAFTGSSALSIPVPVPEARDGMSPNLVLGYSSGGGNSAYGAGWSLSGLAAVGIDTRYHVPRWDDTDGFQFGNDELVPWLMSSGGTWTPRGFVSGDWSVAFYRSRRGSTKIRVEKWVHTPTGRIHFRTRDPYNCVTVYGARPNAAGRIADPTDETRTFAWLPELILDTNGNAVLIEYAEETLDGIDRIASYERLQPTLSQRYLKHISFGNLKPLSLDDALASGQLPAGTQWCFQVVADYGDHSDPNTPNATPDRPWLARQDPFSTYSCGFEVRTYRLCRRFLVFHNFRELGPSPTLVRSLVLTHEENPAGSTLTQIELIGYRHDSDTVKSAALPPLKMSFAPAATDTAFLEAPHESSINAPAGLAANRYSFVDLYGEGLPGILYQDERTWYYKSNHGNCNFGTQTVVAKTPALTANAFICSDLDANGNTEFAQLGGRNAGLYELHRETETWSGFRTFPAFPHVEALSADTRWVDLNGDRRPDVVLTQDDHFTWFASDRETFLPPVDVPHPAGIDAIPTLADDTALDFIFADMTGDGLADLVRIRPGCVTYWPSLGNGYFGDAVVMEGAPQFAPTGQFDASRVRVADLDGSGTTDIVYLGHGQVTCWINAAGNQLVPGPLLGGLPYFDNVSNVRVLDFLGDGRPCLVWSSPLPGRESALEYLSLAPAVRPRLLLQVDDSLGRLTTLTYSSSSTHYLRDIQSGRGWNTRMPGHHPVVDRRKVVDNIAKTGSLQRFEYHDGFYDSYERELRGFGQVDIYDSDLADQVGAGPTTAAVASPALERRWFHLGTPMWDFGTQASCYAGDPQLPVFSPHVVDGAEAHSADEVEDGLRALVGELIRSEIYAIDTTGVVGFHPIEVMQQRYRLRTLQPANGADRPAFSKILLENATWVYEQAAGDPRLVHELVIETDDYDQPVRNALIGYARRTAFPADINDQSRYHINIRDNARIAFDEAQRYEIGIPSEAISYELAGVRPAQGMFTREQFVDPAVTAALGAPGRHDIDPPDDPLQGPKARILSWEQTFYWDDTQTNPLLVGQAGALTLLHHEEAACFEPAFITDTFGARVDNTLLAQLGYTLRDGFWWQSDETYFYLPAAQFRGIASLLRGDGARTQFGHDPYALVQKAHTDPLNNTLIAEIDYYELAPWRITDANGSVTEVRYDPLGVIIACTTYGTMGSQQWGYDPLSAVAIKTPTSVADAVVNASALIQGAMQYTWYDLSAWSNSAMPTTLVTLTRETLVHDGQGGSVGEGVIEIVVSYVDALGRLLQEKKLVETGPAIARDESNHVILDPSGQPVMITADPCWRASGHIAYDAKERPAREFEPFFSGTPAYEGDTALQVFGTSTLTRYDVLGREVGQDFANGTFNRTVYKSWSIEESDPNDTVLDSAYGAARQSLPAGDPERQAYEEAAPHANTLNIDYLDPLGRSSGHLAQGGATAADQFTQSHRDLNDCEKDIVDPRGLTAFRVRFDMQSRPLYQNSIDAGDIWHLPDAYGRDTNIWDSRNFAIVHGYDVADRLLYTDVMGGDGPVALDNRVEEWIYGESLANRNDAISRNLLGHVAITHDGAQQMTVNQCDPGGRVCSITRQLHAVIDTEPDLRVAVHLEPDTFVETATFDGLGRTLTDTLADGTARSFSYARSGVLTNIRVTTPDGSINDVPILNGASVNARGQRLTESCGNGVALQYVYDPNTYQLVTQSASRGGTTFQQIVYTYDPVGNIVRLTDAAQEGPNALLAGLAVPARRDYLYDAHYRVRQATGRVHQALLQHDFVPGTPGTVKGTRHISLNNGAAIERFTRRYDYDSSGNLLSVTHMGKSQNWTTQMWVSSTSNRSMPALDLNGIKIANPDTYYDAAGNQNRLAHLRKMEWNWRNELAHTIVISRPGGTDDAERYLYGADGLRVRKVTTRLIGGDGVEVTEKVYFNDLERKRISRGGNVILERWSVHVNDGDSRIAIVHRWTKDTAAREVDDTSRARIHYQLTTHQASVALELDENAALITYEEYFPYGDTSFIAGNNLCEIEIKDYRYSNKECDDFTGLYAYGYRYYAPWMGRWVSPDPNGPSDDLNLYQFALGDPVRNVDPDGLDSQSDEVQYVYRELKLPEGTSVSAKIAAYREWLRPEQRPFFDSLKSGEQETLVMASPYSLLLAPKDLNDLSKGGMLLTRDMFEREYKPKYIAWAKKENRDPTIDFPIPPAQGDPAAPLEADVDPATGKGLIQRVAAAVSQAVEAYINAATSEGASTRGKDGDKNAATAGAGGNGSGKDAGDGTKTTSAAGIKGSETVDQGNGAGTMTGTGKQGIGSGTGAGTGAGQESGSGSGGGHSGLGKARIGSSFVSPYGEIGGRSDGVHGGSPFSPGTSPDGPGNPLTNASPSNGSEQDGEVGQTRRRSGHGPRMEGSGARSGGSGTGGGTRQGHERGSPTGSGGPPGSNKTGSLTGTTAAQPHPNANATGHGSDPTGSTGAWATTLLITGFLNMASEKDVTSRGPGGIPGGRGKLKGGLFWQILYVALTIVDLILVVRSVVKSVAKGAWSRLLRAIRSPREILRALGGRGKPTKNLFAQLFWIKSKAKSAREAFNYIRSFRNKSTLFMPRLFGTLERVGKESLYSSEHIISLRWGEKHFPRLVPFFNSYANTFLRLPLDFNRSLGNRRLPRLLFYYGAVRAVLRSWKIGSRIGEKASEKLEK